MVIGQTRIRPTPKPHRWAISLGTSLGNRQTSPHTVPNKLFQPFPGVSQGFHSCPVVRYLPKSQVAHNPKVAGSNPAPATNQINHWVSRSEVSDNETQGFT